MSHIEFPLFSKIPQKIQLLFKQFTILDEHVREEKKDKKIFLNVKENVYLIKALLVFIKYAL